LLSCDGGTPEGVPQQTGLPGKKERIRREWPNTWKGVGVSVFRKGPIRFSRNELGGIPGGGKPVKLFTAYSSGWLRSLMSESPYNLLAVFTQSQVTFPVRR